MTGESNSKRFTVGELVESVFEKGTVYRVTQLHPPQRAYEYSTFVSLEDVKLGEHSGYEGEGKGRMGDGHSVAPYHLNAV